MFSKLFDACTNDCFNCVTFNDLKFLVEFLCCIWGSVSLFAVSWAYFYFFIVKNIRKPKAQTSKWTAILIVDDYYQIGRTNFAGLCFLKTSSPGIYVLPSSAFIMLKTF